MTYTCLCGHAFKRWRGYYDHWRAHDAMMVEGRDLLHVLEIQVAIERCIAGEVQHGGFVTYMTRKDYRNAAFQADGTMQRVFCELIKWREWLDDQEVKERWKDKIVHGETDAVHEDGAR